MALTIIAELGGNLFPYSRERLSRLLGAAKRSGVDAVKIQVFVAEHFIGFEAVDKRRLEFPRGELDHFVTQVHLLGLLAGASVFDIPAVRQCRNSGVDFLKLAAREENNIALRVSIQAEFLGTVYRSVNWPLFREAEPALREITMAAVQIYPSIGLANLGNQFLAGSMPPVFGWSSHTDHWDDCLAAIRSGASAIEKHLSLTEDDEEARWSLNELRMTEAVTAMRAAYG